MADEVTKTDTTVDGDSPGKGSDATALTPEQRDEQTIARTLGTGTEKTEESATADETATPDPDAATETADEKPADTTEATAGDEDSDADTADELTAEEIELILDALDPEKLIENPRLKALVEARAQADADRRVAEQQAATSVSEETKKLIEDGKEAFGALTTLLDSAKDNIDKAIAGTEFVPVVIDPAEVKKHLGSFAQSFVLRTRQSFDDAFATAFRETAQLTGAAFTQDEANIVTELVKNAERIRHDPEQGEAASTAFLYRETFKYLVNRARATGKAEALAEVKRKSDAVKQIKGDENTTRAAIAKVAKQRTKTPPPSTEPGAGIDDSNAPATMESYKAAKAAGKFDVADSIMERMQR